MRTALAAALACAALAAGESVVVVQSYERDYDWSLRLDRSLAGALRQAGIEAEYVFMDGKRLPAEAAKRAAGERARAIVAARDPAVVIACDDIAQQYFAAAYAGRERPQIVFCGVNAEAAAYGYPAANVTGVLQRPHAHQSLALLRRVAPAVRSVVILSDATETATLSLPQIQAELARNPVPGLHIAGYRQTGRFEEWKQIVGAWQANADALGIYTYHSMTDAAGRVVPAAEVMAWTMAAWRKPSVGFHDFAVQDGVLLAVAMAAEEHGALAAAMARDLLAGRSAAEMPIVIARQGRVAVNLATASAIGIAFPAEILARAERYGGGSASPPCQPEP